LDGAPYLESVDGKAREIDPGPHLFRAELQGDHRVIEERIVVREGEKNRLVRLAPAPTHAPRTDASNPRPPASAAVPVGPLALGGLGVVATASFAYFGLRAGGEASDARACEKQPGCDNVDTRNRAIAHARIADASLGIAVLAFAGAGVWYFLDRR